MQGFVEFLKSLGAARMAAMAAANLIAGVRGERLPNPVNPEIYGADSSG